MEFPDAANKILYVRVTEKNKKFMERLSKKEGRSQAALMNQIIEWYRDASNKRKSK